MATLRIVIPEGLAFEALKLTRGPAGVQFDWAPIRTICELSGIDVEVLRRHEDDGLTTLMMEWYTVHRQLSGAADPVMEQLLAEVAAEGDRDAHDVQPSAGRVQ